MATLRAFSVDSQITHFIVGPLKLLHNTIIIRFPLPSRKFYTEHKYNIRN